MEVKECQKQIGYLLLILLILLQLKDKRYSA